MIAAHNGIKSQNVPPINIEDYPAIKQHLDQYYEKLAQRADKGDTPYNLRNCVYMDDFSKQKIVYREISDTMDACIVEAGIYLNNKCYLITGEHLIYLLSIFNSVLFNKIFLSSANITGGKGVDFLQKVKIPFPTNNIEQQFQMLYAVRTSHPEKSTMIDNQVDDLVCSIYQLTESERKSLVSM